MNNNDKINNMTIVEKAEWLRENIQNCHSCPIYKESRLDICKHFVGGRNKCRNNLILWLSSEVTD